MALFSESKRTAALIMLVLNSASIAAFTTIPWPKIRSPPSFYVRPHAVAVTVTASSLSGDDAEEELMAVRTPLRWLGPYPALALRYRTLMLTILRYSSPQNVLLQHRVMLLFRQCRHTLLL